MWASLPCDLLVDIFRRLEATASSDAPPPAGHGGAPSSATPRASSPIQIASTLTSSSASSTETGGAGTKRGCSTCLVCHGGGSVYRIIRVFTRHPSSARRRVFAIDMCTERTWTMELPEKHAEITDHDRFVLATSEDGRLSLISQLRDHQIEVWVLVGFGEWTLRRMINVHNVQIPGFLEENNAYLTIKGFCPWSGCLFGYINYNKDLLFIDVNTGNLRLVQKFGIGYVTKYPYEMDWSTYISKMYF